MSKILIVDDERSIRVPLRTFLLAEGYDVEIAENAAQAKALLSNGVWDVVVTDIVLPGISGLKLLKTIRAAAYDVQVIMMTGEPTAETAAEAVRAGASDYLIKPVDKSAILRAVAQAAKVKTLEDNRRRIEEELKTAKEDADAANRAKSDFLSSMSHELRTPLNAVIGFSEVLADKTFGELNEKQGKYVNNVLDAGRYLLSLINDILDLSKVESGKMELELSTFPLAAVLNNSLVMVKEKCMKQRIALSLDIKEPIMDLEISADERKLKQIMFNLLSNAVKFTPERGSITVSAGISEQLAVSSDTRTSSDSKISAILISVSDTGIGIKPEDQERIFHEFEQVDSIQTRKHKGTGLGLTLVKRFVELQGGRVWVDSEFGKGSTFWFTIPMGREQRA